jgi:hypothetical protein
VIEGIVIAPSHRGIKDIPVENIGALFGEFTELKEQILLG